MGASWEASFKTAVRSGREGWNIANNNGRMQLKLRGKNLGIQPQSANLPFPWEQGRIQDALLLVAAVHPRVMAGEVTLKTAIQEAGQTLAAQHASSEAKASWPAIVDAYKRHLQTRKNQIPDSTYDCNYKPYFQVALELLRSRTAPQTGPDLINEVLHAQRTSNKPGTLYGTPLTPWAEQTSSRYACCLALKNLLEYAFDKHGVARCWRVGKSDYDDLLGPKQRNRPKAALTDQEILDLHAAIKPRNHRWANVIRLLAAYGLREWEINHLEVRENHKGQPQMFCSKGKVSANRGRKQQNPERWLIDLPLSSAEERISWGLVDEWSSNAVELPNTVDGKAFGTWLRRQPEWKELVSKYDAQGQYLKPYAFRHSFSVRCTRYGIADSHASEVMGHSPEVHRRSYRTSRQEDVLDAFTNAKMSA